MKRGDLKFNNDKILVNFPPCKGGKEKQDELEKRVSKSLAEWLYACYGTDLANLPNETPIGVSLSRRNPRAPLGIQSIGDVCSKRLGISRVHMLRHMFAVAMDDAGAPLVEIQNRLGHDNLATTSRYMQRVKEATNPYAAKLADMFGAGD
jgi:integrase